MIKANFFMKLSKKLKESKRIEKNRKESKKEIETFRTYRSEKIIMQSKSINL